MLDPENQRSKHPIYIADKKLLDNDPKVKRVTARTVIAGQKDSDNSTECVKNYFNITTRNTH